MSLKDLFKEQNFKYLSNYEASLLISGGIESSQYVEAYLEERNRFIPLVDFSKPENFARFGSAEKYYYDSISTIYKTYPYDGSKKEKILWELSSSGLDLYIFENDYPRTTGYAVFSTSSLTATDTSTDYTIWGSYGAAGTASYEFVSFNGGPNAGEGTKIHIDPDTGEAHYRENANLFDLSNNRECNLKIGGNDGNTVEFWLKKAEFNPAATQTEVVFDIFTTASISSSAGYGRLTVEMSGHGASTNTLSPFYVTYMSGTNGISKENIGSSLTTTSIADDNWHHYSFRFKNEGSNTSVDLFVDGEFNHNVKTGTTVDYVSGTIVGTIGSLAAKPSGSTVQPQAEKGWGKLSGSIDEFRFWKVWRESKEIQTRWFDQVGGGTNSDDANTHLGLYYKFNEGITTDVSIDSKVLDYSGRITNGSWTGFLPGYSRETGSAINETLLTSFSGSEFKDPILYTEHPLVASLLSTKRLEGREYDYRNPSTIYYSLPGWILDDHDTNNIDGDNITANTLWNLTQIIGSYFDNATNLIKSIPSLSQTDYISGSQKPIPFMNRILESKGFIAPEIFNAIDALEDFENRDNKTLYDEKISDIKNLIYQNIYNNLTFINKSKGTEKSFRNLIRCFGINDQIYKLNIYSNNVDFVLDDNYRQTSEKFKNINFNTIPNSNAIIYQYSSSLNSNTVTFISASENFTTTTSPEAGLPFSVEANIVFPNRVAEGDYRTLRQKQTVASNNYPLIITSSLFGMHTADSSDEHDTTFNSNDFANFIVKSVKPSRFSDKAKFVLTGTAGGFVPELSSSYIDDVYDDTNWSFLFCLYPEKYPNVNQISGSTAADSPYVVEFSGIQKITDTTLNEFTVTGTMTADQATKFLASPKRTFIGSHRTNFTGSLINSSDVKFNTIRVWQNKLTIEDLKVHASDPSNYSIKNPEQNAYLFNTSINNVYIPNKETLLLHWNFTQVTSSDASGEFIVQDATSGSISQIERYGFLSNIVNKQFTGRGHEFLASSDTVVVTDDIITAKPNLPEVISNENTIKVLTNDDIYYTRDSRPTFFDLYVEKSAYQNISEEMLKFMSTVVDFNNLIGHTVDRYREEYKSLKMLRQLFFQRTSDPDIDKYIEYFKWFDLAVSAMIQKIAPISSGLDDRPLRNIIESHILERNKYQSKFPTYEFKQTDPEGRIFGINELTYPWKEGHAPLEAFQDQSDNCLWSKERGERDSALLTSGDVSVDSDRQEVLDVINNLNDAPAPNLSGSAGGTYQGSTYALRRFARPYKINAVKQPHIHGGGNAHENNKVGFWDSLRKNPTPPGGAEGALLSIEPPDSKLESFKDCDDNLELNRGKRKFKFSIGVSQDDIEEFTGVFKGDLIFPFSLYSSSINDNPALADLTDFQTNLAVTNLHHDGYGPHGDVPMQGPFTEKYVGGRPYRHVMTNFTPDNNPPDTEGERLEGWRLTASVGALDLVNVDPAFPKSVYFREEYAKRPVNIKNIQQLTGAVETEDQATDASGVTKIGNYTHTYEIVMTNGRSTNNRYLAESDGDLPTTSTDSLFVSGVVDFALPRRDLTGSNKAIIVNRFSAPGDPATMGEGLLDVAAAEFSVYNALPFRNLSVRMPLNELHSDHTNQFGLFSDARTVADHARIAAQGHTFPYPGGSSSINDPGADLSYIGTGSFHKVNRNTRKQLKYSNEHLGHTGTVHVTASFDNFFVQHQIPQTDVQYAWITASLIENYAGSALYGFEQPDFSNASLASTDLTFVSASDSGSLNIKVDFAGLNTLVIDNVLSASNLLSSSDYYNDDIESLDDALTTNAVISHRGGPAGGSNWKLYRKDNHPIVRTHREENRISFLTPEFILNDQGQQILSGGKGTIDSVIEPPITSKYKQITHLVVDNKTKDQVNINHTYMNNIRFFTDHSDAPRSINLDLTLLDPKKNVKIEQQMLDVINYYLYNKSDFDGAEDLNPIDGLISFTTRETIYPREQFTYLSTHRQRNNFENGFWRDSRQTRADRGISFVAGAADSFTTNLNSFDPFLGFMEDGVINRSTFGNSVVTASIWPLDARNDFVNSSPGRIKSGTLDGIINNATVGIVPPMSSSGRGGGNDGDLAGLLQNNVYPYSVYTFATGGVFTLLPVPVPPPGDAEDKVYVIGARLLPQYNRRIAATIGGDNKYEFMFGDTKWEAADLSNRSPFYDTYDDYVDDIKRTGKDHSILPEFRISNHMDYYLNNLDGDFFGPIPNDLYEITGSTLSSSNQTDFIKTYSHSDFLRTFSIVNDFYGDNVDVKNVSLSVDALIKFLPYDGFYPADRTVQVAKLFYDSYSASFAISGNIFGAAVMNEGFTPGEVVPKHVAGAMNPVWKPLFAPGILYNSIKSGIAVDYPVHTSPPQFTGSTNQRNARGYLENIPRITGSFDERVPFEALYNPDLYLRSIENIHDSEPHPSASINITASLAAPGKDNYSLAMNNFLASTIDFFLRDSSMSQLVSLSEADSDYGQALDSAGQGFLAGKEYKMRVVCHNSVFSTFVQATTGTSDKVASYRRVPHNIVMYAQTGSDPTRRADYYGSAFGPPVDAIGSQLCTGQTPGDISDNLNGSASYEPFTPPYYDGYSHIELTYRPTDSGVQGVNLPLDVISNSTYTYFRDHTSRNDAGYTAAENSMQLSASVDIKVATEFSKKFDTNGNLVEADDGANNSYRIAIQPKWETPILDFKNVDPILPIIGSGSIARGMWHQYGEIPSGDSIFLEVQDLSDFEKDDPALTGSLARQLGFGAQVNDKVKLGRLNSSKKISEAVVALPYRPGQLFNIDREIIDDVIAELQKKNISNSELKANLPNIDPSIIEMVRKMKKYVIPPHLDFINNLDLEPFAMFIFDFEVTLDSEDLKNIWQNLEPDIARATQKKFASLPIDIFTTTDSNPKTAMMDSFPDDTRWFVFKVKQRSINSMRTKLPASADDKVQFTNILGQNGNGGEKTYSFNWPFDFFSLVELAKIDASVTSSPKTIDSVTDVGSAGFAAQLIPQALLPPTGEGNG